MSKKILFLLGMCLFFVGNVHGTLDDLEIRLRSQEAIQIRWDNIEDDPFWVSGPRPCYDMALDLHLVTLSKQEPVTVRLTKESYLRIHSPFTSLCPNDVEVLVSNGSGLFLSQHTFISGNDLVLAPLHFGGTVVKVKLRQNHKECSKQVALFISRYVPPAPMAPYRTLLDTCADQEILLSHTTGVPEQSDLWFVNKLNPFKTTNVQVTGPVRLNLVTYLTYGSLETTYPFMYRMNVCMDGRPYHTAEYIARADDGKVYYKDLTPYLLSYPNISPLEIPAGEHNLVLTSNANLFFQLRELEDQGYALPFLNSPNLDDRPLPPNGTALELNQNDVKTLVNSKNCPITCPSRLEQVALKLGKDNFWKTNGLQSVCLLQDLSQKRPDALDLKSARDKSDGLFVFYRDLLPTRKLQKDAPLFAWAVDWDLRDPRDEDKPTFVLENQKDSLLNYLVSGYFLPVSSSRQSASVYALPNRTSPGYLRLLVNQSGLNAPQLLWVQYDKGCPFKLIIGPDQDLCSPAYKPTHGLTGLSILNDPQGTLGGLFNVRHNPGPLLPAGSLEIPLPADIKEIRVWQAHEGCPLDIALQYQASKPYRLEQPMMVKELECIPNTEDLFFTCLNFVLTSIEKKKLDIDFNTFWCQLEGYSEENKQPIAELYNHWLKLLRLLTFRHQKLIEGYGKVDPIFVSSPTQNSHLSIDLKVAENFAAKKQDLEAFQAWGRLLHSSNINMWRKAHIGRIAALQNLGESYLLERYLKSIFLKTHDDELKNIAFKELFKFYTRKQDYFALEGLLTEQFLRTRNSKNLTLLSQTLLEDNNEALAIDLAHVVNAEHQRPEDILVFSALRNNRARNGERLGENVETPEDSFFWNAQLDQINGRYECALENFNQAGPKGALWRDHLVQGMTIQKRLFSCDIGERFSAIEDWVLWLRNHPGPYFWKPANYLVSNFFQATSLYSDIVDGYTATYIASPRQPVQLKIIGPALLQFQVRVLFKKNVEIPYQGWVEIQDNNKPLHLPIVYTYPSEGLEVIGHQGKAGVRGTYEISVGPGEHLINILPQNTDIIVEPFIKAPIVPLSVLPPLTHHSLAFILNEGTLGQKEGDNLEVNILQEKNLLSVFDTVSADPRLYITNFPADSLQVSQILRGLLKSEILKSYPLSPKEQQSHYLANILWEYEKKPSEKLLNEAQKFWASHREDPDLSRLWGRFTQLSSWTPIEIPQQSAGIRSLPKVEGWEPDTPETVLRKDLIEEDPEDYLLTENGRLVFQLYNEHPTTVKIDSALASLATDDLGTISWAYQVDNGEIHKVHFPPTKRSNVREITIPQGEHSLKFFVEKPVRDIFVKLKLSERTPDAPQWKPLTVEGKKDYLLATSNEPVQLDIEGPAWIRVDEWVDGQIIRKDYNLGKGAQKLKLRPSDSRQEGLFRVFKRIARAPADVKPQVPTPPPYVVVEDTPVYFDDFTISDPICGKEVLPLNGQANGTWSLTASWNRVLGFAQNNLDGIVFQPNMSLDKVDKYLEERATYRYFDEINRMYWKAEALARQRTINPSFGILGEVDYSPINLPITFWGAGTAYAQNYRSNFKLPPGSAPIPGLATNQTQHLSSGTLIGGIRHKLVFTEKADQKVNLSILGRKIHFKNVLNVLPFNPNINIPNLPDRDVFSQYLANHARALNFDYKFYYRPLMDNRLRAEFLAISNPKLHLLSPDSITGRWGMDQLIGEFILSGDYAITHFYRNMNQSNLVHNRPQSLLTEVRPFAFNRNIVSATLTWNHWLPNHDRLECRFDAGRVWDTQLPIIPFVNAQGVVDRNRPGTKQRGVKQWIGFISFTWHFGNGRDFRDFNPEDIAFKDIRERDVPPVQIPYQEDFQ